MKAFVFPGQGSHFVGMGKDLYKKNKKAKDLFEYANEILGFRITDIMFYGNENKLKNTNINQLAIYIYSVIKLQTLINFYPDMTAGHSLGEFSALFTAGVINFKNGIKLVSQRASIMNKICKSNPSSMVAILGLNDDLIQDVCKKTNVFISNYNCPGQTIISGNIKELKIACKILKNIGAKKIITLPVSGGFHSPIMNSGINNLKNFIEKINLKIPKIYIYQNLTSNKTFEIEKIKKNIIYQLIYPVNWIKLIEKMIKDGASKFFEIGPKQVLTNIIKRINNKVTIYKI